MLNSLPVTHTVPLFFSSHFIIMMAAAPPQESTMVRTPLSTPAEGWDEPLALHWQKDAPARGGKGEASTPVQPASRHDEFYFTDDMTVFQVCDRQLVIPRVPSLTNVGTCDFSPRMPRTPSSSAPCFRCRAEGMRPALRPLGALLTRTRSTCPV